MTEKVSYGSVRGASRKARSYRDISAFMAQAGNS